MQCFRIFQMFQHLTDEISSVIMAKTYRLLVKTHNKTGLRYLCQTSKDDYVKYPGSGMYWKRHLDTHGKDFSTEAIGEYNTLEELSENGIIYSNEWNIVESVEWANLIVESEQGGDTSAAFTEESYRKMRASSGGINNANYGKVGELSPNFGKKYGKNPELSVALKERWSQNADRKRLASVLAAGSKNFAAKPCVVDGIEFGCLKDAAIYFNCEDHNGAHNYTMLRNNHTVVIK